MYSRSNIAPTISTLLLIIVCYNTSETDSLYIISGICRFLDPCAERGDVTHPVVYPESDELQQGGASGEGVPSLRQHGLLRERDALVQGIRDEDV